MKSKNRVAIAQYEATVVLIVLSLSLASVVYGGLKRETSLGATPVFFNEVTPIGGSPPIVRIGVNASSTTTLSSLSLDEAISRSGILAFDGSAYSSSGSLCAAGVTTFFSVLSPQSGALKVTTDGRAWISGTYGTSVAVGPGWQELMIQAGTTCSITLPGGQQVPSQWSPSSSLVSSIPTLGSQSGTGFTFYIPNGGGPHRLLLTSSGGFDVVPL
jgi:hypothetical protein